MAAPTSCLTRCPGQAYSPPHGLGRPKLEAHKSRAIHVRGFFVQNGKSYGRSMWESARIAGPRAGLPTRMESPTLLAGGERLSQPQLEDNTMSQDRTPGVSAETTYRYISLDTAIKRARRHLAKTGASLVKSKAGTKAWRELGDFSIRDASGEVVMKSVNLRAMMQTAKILADHERIELPNQPGWRYYVARQVSVQIDGATHYRNEPLSKLYFTEKQAIQAAESITDRDGIVVVGFNAAGGTTHGDL
jgi:hypothetical protein